MEEKIKNKRTQPDYLKTINKKKNVVFEPINYTHDYDVTTYPVESFKNKKYINKNNDKDHNDHNNNNDVHIDDRGLA